MLLISFLFSSFCFIKCQKRQYLIKIKIKGKTGTFLNSFARKDCPKFRTDLNTLVKMPLQGRLYISRHIRSEKKNYSFLKLYNKQTKIVAAVPDNTVIRRLQKPQTFALFACRVVFKF